MRITSRASVIMLYCFRFYLLGAILLLSCCTTRNSDFSSDLGQKSNASSDLTSLQGAEKETSQAGLSIPGIAPGYHLPLLQPGDSFTFDSPPSTWRVDQIKDGLVYWSGEGGGTQVTTLNPILPALSWNSKNSTGSRKIGLIKGFLFPLKKGNVISFETIVQNAHAEGVAPFFWSCQVGDSKQLTVPAGTFDVVQVHCVRQGSGVWNFYYAPKLGFYVKIESSNNEYGKIVVRRLVSYNRPSLDLSMINNLKYFVHDRTHTVRMSLNNDTTSSQQCIDKCIDKNNIVGSGEIFCGRNMYGIHVYSFKSKKQLFRGYQELMKKYSFIPRKLSIFSMKVCVHGCYFYRLILGPVRKDKATMICAKIRNRHGSFCSVLPLKDTTKVRMRR